MFYYFQQLQARTVEAMTEMSLADYRIADKEVLQMANSISNVVVPWCKMTFTEMVSLYLHQL